jgi:NADH dehydrogenase
VHFLEGTVEHVDLDRRLVRVHIAGGDARELPFDHVVVALGATTNVSVIPGSENARTFKTMADGLLLRNHLIERLERADVESNVQRRKQLLSVVVIGGGLVGSELLGELSAFMREELRYYPNIAAADLSFHLFEAGGRLIPEAKQFLADYAARILTSRGAVLHTSTPVTAIDPGVVRWKDGFVESDTIVLAPGIMPSAVSSSIGVERDHKGRIVTDAMLRSVSHQNVWAFGDCAATPAPRGGIYPALAQHAVRAARVVAQNVVAALAGKDGSPFVFESLGTMAAFGHTRAAAEVRGLELTGFIAWWIRRTYYLFQMPRWDTRLRIALDWTVALLSRPDLTKIDLASEREQERRNLAAGQ